MSIKSRLLKLEGLTRQGEQIIVAVEDEIEARAIMERHAGQRILVIVTGIPRTPGGLVRRKVPLQ